MIALDTELVRTEFANVKVDGLAMVRFDFDKSVGFDFDESVGFDFDKSVDFFLYFLKKIVFKKDCSVGAQRLTLNQQVTGQVLDDAWKDYSIDISSGNSMTVSMDQTSSSGDCDLFLRFGSPATLFEWDYLNATLDSKTTLTVTYPTHGTWYIGVYGFSACSFTLQVRAGSFCPSQCSRHGTCSGNSCSCRPGYSGEACENRISPLQNAQTETGFVSSNFWNYYTFVSNSADNIVISVNQEQTIHDCDIYVKAGARPTRFSYDYQDASINQNFSLSIPDPGDSAWNIGVYGWSDCAYQIIVSDSSSCPNNCNNHGTCNSEGHCLCSTGFAGEACEYTVTSLSNNAAKGQSGNISLSNNEWNYYSIAPIPGSTSLHILMKELSTSGYVWLFSGKEVPTLRHYDLSDESIASDLHKIKMDLNATQTENSIYYIGVYGNPFLPSDSTASYEIVGWYASP